ncbi:MAG: DUF805 domain-containing protein [Robiginitomaculum sp.]|nr:DUF805 domain-containing protein [Robiginitomaculum sp.]
MGNLFFSFKGRLNAADFQRSAIILIVIGAVLNIVPYFLGSMAIILGVLSLVLIWPWLALWIKRYHDANKSGWMVLLPIVVLIVLGIGTSFVVNQIMPIDQSAVEAAGTDFMEIMRASTEAVKHQMIPNAIVNAVVQLAVVFGFNAMIKSDPEENRFGPATN